MMESYREQVGELTKKMVKMEFDAMQTTAALELAYDRISGTALLSNDLHSPPLPRGSTHPLPLPHVRLSLQRWRRSCRSTRASRRRTRPS